MGVAVGVKVAVGLAVPVAADVAVGAGDRVGVADGMAVGESVAVGVGTRVEGVMEGVGVRTATGNAASAEIQMDPPQSAPSNGETGANSDRAVTSTTSGDG